MHEFFFLYDSDGLLKLILKKEIGEPGTVPVIFYFIITPLSSYGFLPSAKHDFFYN